jgi:glycosyltransferase involved in cell wall biosynthesis
MRVLMISADPALAVVASEVFARVSGYAAEAGEIVIALRTVGGPSAEAKDGPLAVSPTASRSKLDSFFDLRRLAARLARERGPFDLVTAQDPFEHGLVAWRLARALGLPLELQLHTDFAAPGFAAVSRANRFRARLARFLIPRAASVRAVSSRAASAALAAGARRVSVAPVRADLGALLGLPAPEPWRGDGAFEVVTVSRLAPEKRIEVLIDAVATLRASGVPARLTVIGDGPERGRLERLAAPLGGAARFAGRLSSPLASGEFHAYAQASAFEGYGLSLLEAAARGLPVVTTGVGLVGDALRDGESCLVVGDAPAAAAALAKIAGDPALGERLGAAARVAARAESDRVGETVVGAWRAALDARRLRLFVVTQALDADDTVLGFFCRWVDELAARSESVVAACLRRGRYEPPGNARVVSLGKGEGRALPGPLQKLRYAIRFLGLAWRERRSYDAVFVHMNEEYVLVAGLLWRLLGKRMTMWRNHYAGSWKTRLAGRLCHEVFCTSRSSYTASFPNVRLMPVGVPLDRFGARPDVAREPRSVLFLGRVAPSKNLDLAVDALASLAEAGVDFRATVVGDPLPEHVAFAAALRARADAAGLGGLIDWRPGVPNAETPAIYAAHEIFVNPSRSGMFDKTMLEAAASGCRVVYSSEDARGLFGGAGFFDLALGAPALAAALRASLDGADGWDPEAAARAAAGHSLGALADALAARLAC